MAKFRFSDDSKRRVTESIRAFGTRKVAHMSLALASWALDTKAAVQRQYIDVAAFDQGLLVASVDVTPVTMVGSKLRVVVFTPLEYASVVEFGRRANSGGRPPLLPLVGWAGRKGITTAVRATSPSAGSGRRRGALAGDHARHRARRRGRFQKKAKQEPLDPIVRDMLIVRLIAEDLPAGHPGPAPLLHGLGPPRADVSAGRRRCATITGVRIKDAVYREIRFACRHRRGLDGLVARTTSSWTPQRPSSMKDEADYPWLIFRRAHVHENNQVRLRGPPSRSR